MKTLMVSFILLSAAVNLAGGNPGGDLKLTILYDNYQHDEQFKNSWGFSCLIEGLDKTILFDCGGKDGNLMHNLEAAGFDPSGVDLVVISHEHWAHTGGLVEFLTARRGIDVWMPASFLDRYSDKIEEHGCRAVPVSGPAEIIPGVWTTGEMGMQIIEQSLVLDTPEGLIVMTGCAHPGIEEIVGRAGEINKGDILLVMGGFHLLRTGKKAVEETARGFREAGIKFAAPTHCSGDGTIKVFQEVFGDNFVPLGAGKVLYPGKL